MTSANIIQDNPDGTTAKTVRTLDFNDDSDEDLLPTQEEIDAFNNDWY